MNEPLNAKLTYDQAEGLRRLIARPAPRLMTLLSADGPLERTLLLANIAATLTFTGRKVTVLETSNTSSQYDSRLGVQRPSGHDLALIDVVQQRCALTDALHASRFGFQFAALNRQTVKASIERADVFINGVVGLLATECDVVLVGAELDAEGQLPLQVLDQGEVMLQVSPSRKSITNAYALIKRLVNRTGRRPFGILVTGASEVEAQTIFNNLSQAASLYLSIRLNACGALPKDEALQLAARSGRSVVDAFPLAEASVALRRIADGLAYPCHSASNSASHSSHQSH